MADKESYIMLWDMLVLLLRPKGQVEGSELAELLLKDTRDTTGHREMYEGTTSFARSESGPHPDGQGHGEHCPHHSP